MNLRTKNRRAFSLIELVIVIIIMGVISAIAIPRMVRGAEGADVTALQADLAVLRGAIEMYRYEHGIWPDPAQFQAQLTGTTIADGTPDAMGQFGPYLVKMPPLKTGAQKDEVAVKGIMNATAQAADVAAGFGWLYNNTNGGIWANDVDHLDK
ncbi:MAG: prepilin-type N-terminal cleavage/methylation domain-containing protein [Phycisphaerales bacterium]|nr:prepilin-type N-terminal cleavage/methylation domain-containing protein [Phycisphaerae bacterium]NNF44182.1 prepilin-type N-terminal cleavage/methylation domain-containing protein [Phycisphaerales bacterium]NNM24456.1 prepilin-type N-terminal cleavage/methylation domain-containing protein [Phycisphaerales bacterium]